jgi:hypothetical protein
VIETNGIEPILSQLNADGALGVMLEEVTEPSIRDPPAGCSSALCLLELIAVVLIVEEIGEVRKQVDAVVQQIACREH